MKTYVTFAMDGEPMRSLKPSYTIAFDGPIVLPYVGDVVGNVTSGIAERRTGKVISRQFTYFADEVRVFHRLECYEFELKPWSEPSQSTHKCKSITPRNRQRPRGSNCSSRLSSPKAFDVPYGCVDLGSPYQ